LLNKSTKLINELFDNYVSNYLTSYRSPYLTQVYQVYQMPLQADACSGQRGRKFLVNLRLFHPTVYPQLAMKPNVQW